MPTTPTTVKELQTTQAPVMTQAIVTGQAEKWFFLQGTQGEFRARCALSCLVVPEIGDTVLVSVSEDPLSSYILAILLRPSAQQCTVKLPGETTLLSASGNLVMQAETVIVQGKQSLQLEAPRFGLEALVAEVRVKLLHSWFEQLHNHIVNLKTITQNMTTIVERQVTRARESFRWIEQTDETRAGRVHMLIKNRLQIQAKHASITAEGLVKIDGQKIDLG
jgi:hypothetical protein